jgi:hypothetical protein
MTLRAYQAALARLVIEPSFRDDVRANPASFSDYDLTDRERSRIAAAAADRGMDVTRMLHKGWRLNKILVFMPATCALLGDDRLAEELGVFWQGHPPTSLYFLEEALAFCDHLERKTRMGLTLEHLPQVVAYERANLESRRPPSDPILASH